MTTATAAKSAWRPLINERPMEMGYVLKDVFNARMDKMEALMERNLLKHEASFNEVKKHMEQIDKRMDKMDDRMDKVEGRMDRIERDVSDIRGDVKALTLAFSAMQSRFALHLAWMGIVIGFVLAIAQRFWR